jgi:hypothetical protein
MWRIGASTMMVDLLATPVLTIAAIMFTVAIEELRREHHLHGERGAFRNTLRRMVHRRERKYEQPVGWDPKTSEAITGAPLVGPI